MEFAREATKYYSRQTYRRVIEAVTKPPQIGIDTKIAAITAAITEIEKEKGTLDSQQLNQVHIKVEEVQCRVDDIRDGVEGKESRIIVTSSGGS